MPLTLKAELETWVAALKAYDEQDFDRALELFSAIADSSKILTNMGLIYATIGEHETAVEHFNAATDLDSYLAIAHFQCGVSNFLIKRYELALLDFEDAYLFLRGNEAINYEQIGLKFKLFSAEVLFNKGLAQLHLGYTEQGMSDLQEASRQKIVDDHSVIDDAIRDRGQGYTVFSIPVGVLYRPSDVKIKNAKSKDYLGKAKLVAASDSSDAFTEFTGVKKLQQASGEISGNKEDENKPDARLSGPSTSVTVPVPRTEQPPARRVAHERSKTTPQIGASIRPDGASILASRRSQSVSNPANLSPPSNLPKTNTNVQRSNSTRVARNRGATPLRTMAPTTGVVADPVVGGSGTKATEDMKRVARALPRRPSLRKPQVVGTPLVAQQSVPQLPPSSLQPGQYMNTPKNISPLVLPATPARGGHLTQFYDTYMDVYAEDQTMLPVNSRSPTHKTSSSGPSSRRSSPQASTFYQPSQHPGQAQEQQRSPTWARSFPSPVRTNLNSNSHVGMGKASVGGSTVPRKPTRRAMTRRVPVYDDDEGDDGFVSDEYDTLEMATIRVKLHYQGDVRGMTIPPTTAFDEFVERVTTKFRTSLTGLGMKFLDEEGTKISLRDESDFELAIETAREGTWGRPEGKIELWCVDV